MGGKNSNNASFDKRFFLSLSESRIKGGNNFWNWRLCTDIKLCNPEIKLYSSNAFLTEINFSLAVWLMLFSKSSKTFLAKEWVTLVTAEIQPEHPNSKPFKSLVSEPGKILKPGIWIFSYRL